MEDTKTIELNPPIKMGDKSYEALELREPTGDEIDHAQRITISPMAQNMELIARVSGVPVAAIRKLPVSKINEASSFLQVFMNDAQATSES